MSNKTTNFFQISIVPLIQSLYETDIRVAEKIDPQTNVLTRLTRNSYVSLYPLQDSKIIRAKPQYIEWLAKTLLFRALENSKAIFDIDYRSGEFTLTDEKLIQRTEFSILRRVATRVFQAKESLFLVVDPYAKIYNRLALSKLPEGLGLTQQYFSQHDDCLVFVEKDNERKWVHGIIRSLSEATAKVEVPSLFDGTIEVNLSRVIPSLDRSALSSIARILHPQLDLEKEIKHVSESTSKEKLDLTMRIFAQYMRPLFPILVRDTKIDIANSPTDAEIFPCSEIPNQNEPVYLIKREGFRTIESRRLLPGLSQVDISSPIREHKVVLFATKHTSNLLEKVVAQLNEGFRQGNYELALSKKFGIKLNVTDKFFVNDFSEYNHASDIFLQSAEEKHQGALALVYLPLSSDQYYSFKAKLAHHGKVSQIISKETYEINGLWNLATNIYAKLGYEPWELSGGIENYKADIVLGFAYSSLKSDGQLRRNIGYVNVFDRKGIWQFMQSASDYCDFDRRLVIIPQMIQNAINGYLASGSSPKIIDVHYSKRFSHQEITRTFEAIKKVTPTIEEVNFVSLDKTHPLRVFDKARTNFNFTRGGILQLSPNEFLLAAAGTEIPDAPSSRILKVRVWREPSRGEMDIRPIAYRILAMTKLNWRSAVRETTEPVTLKYAEEIAQLTNHFSLTEWATVNNQLSRIPWFI